MPCQGFTLQLQPQDLTMMSGIVITCNRIWILEKNRMKRFFTLRQWKIFHLQIVKKFLPPDYEEVSRGHHFLEVPTPGNRGI